MAVIVGVLLVDVAFSVWDITSHGRAVLTVDAIRFVLTAVLLFLLYRGFNWTRLAFGVLFLMLGAMSLLGAVVSRLLNTVSTWLFVAGLVYVLLAIVLLGSTAVRAFFGRRSSPDGS